MSIRWSTFKEYDKELENLENKLEELKTKKTELLNSKVGKKKYLFHKNSYCSKNHQSKANLITFPNIKTPINHPIFLYFSYLNFFFFSIGQNNNEKEMDELEKSILEVEKEIDEKSKVSFLP